MKQHTHTNTQHEQNDQLTQRTNKGTAHTTTNVGKLTNETKQTT